MEDGKRTKHQKFEMVEMRRGDIREAPYNPRTITEENRKKLRGKIKAVGLLQPVVVNRRTGNLVSSHQRLAALDALERNQNYSLDVSVIDVDEAVEKEMVVFFNNPSAQGEWNLDLLAELNLEHGIDFSEMGFEEYDIDMLFDGDARFAHVFADDEEVVETKGKLGEIKAARKEGAEKMRQSQRAEHFFTVVCKDDEQKREAMRALGVPVFEQFVECAYLLENLRRGPLGRLKKEEAAG